MLYIETFWNKTRQNMNYYLLVEWIFNQIIHIIKTSK